MKLDEKGISTGEYWERHVIISASKQKHPSGYGFYFPAKDGPTDETSLSTKRVGNLSVTFLLIVYLPVFYFKLIYGQHFVKLLIYEFSQYLI